MKFDLEGLQSSIFCAYYKPYTKLLSCINKTFYFDDLIASFSSGARAEFGQLIHEQLVFWSAFKKLTKLMNLKHLVSLEGSIEHQEPLYDPYYYILLDPLLLAPTGRSESQKVKHLSVLEWSKSAIMWSKGYPEVKNKLCFPFLTQQSPKRISHIDTQE